MTAFGRKQKFQIQMASNQNIATKTGFILMLVWCVFLLIAFLIYPKPDNLIVGFIPLILFGVDALSHITILTATIISLIQIIVMFLFGYTLGRYIDTKLGNASQ